MRSKVFKNDKVLVLENEINLWLQENSGITIISTAVADNQFIVIYEPVTTKSKIDNAIQVAKNAKNDMNELSGMDLKKKQQEVHGDTVQSKGIYAPHINDYYKEEN